MLIIVKKEVCKTLLKITHQRFSYYNKYIKGERNGIKFEGKMGKFE